MGSSKRQKHKKPPPPMRSRTTRSSKARLLSDPTENTQQLNDQLRTLGLYAANTLGDGNCLFRALSDQFYGTPSHHLKLRQDICDWIESHKQRYEPFVEDERGLDVHLRCMRQQGTYGGHLELSAFAHLNKRDVKVIQPGLVYVIEWAAGNPLDPPTPSSPQTSDGPQLDERERRRLRREKRRSEKDKSFGSIEASEQMPVYVAYYDWEHFDSIRNLKGPHTGIPNVVERTEDSPQSSSPPSKVKRRPESKPSSKASTLTKRTPLAVQKAVKVVSAPPLPSTPSQVPLPASRSPSPVGLSDPSSSDLPGLYVYPALPNLLDSREHRSPKRTLDESSASSLSETSESVCKRPRSSNPSPSRLTHETSQEIDEGDADSEMEVEMEVDGGDLDAETPGLSPSGFSSESSLSPLSSPSPRASPPALEVRLTRRQKKILGIPKTRPHIAATRGRGTGKIVIPGGKYRKGAGGSAAVTVKNGIKAEADNNAEWAKNGTGRLDVRGFRELKI